MTGQLCDLIVCFTAGAAEYEQVAVHLLKESLQKPFLLIATLSSVLLSGPIIEEFLFRGVLQNWLKQHLKRGSAIILSSFFFALIHMAPSQGLGNIPLFFSLFIFGGFLGFVYERQGSLTASIILHATFNALSTVQIILS